MKREKTWLRPWMIGVASVILMAGIAWAVTPPVRTNGVDTAPQASWPGTTGRAGMYYKTGSGMFVRNPDNSETGPLGSGGGSTGNWVFSGNNATFPATAGINSIAQGSINTTGLTIAPNVADGASSVGLVINNTTDLASGKYVSIRGAGSEQGFLMKAGSGGIVLAGDTVNAFLRASNASGTSINYSTAVMLVGSALASVTDGTATLQLSSGAVSLSGAASINLGDGAVTQVTSITTGVTLNKSTGVITTVTAGTAANSTSTFTVTNSTVASTSAITFGFNYGGTWGTNGYPGVQLGTVSNGSFQIIVTNAHASNALNGVLKIHFSVL